MQQMAERGGILVGGGLVYIDGEKDSDGALFSSFSGDGGRTFSADQPVYRQEVCLTSQRHCEASRQSVVMKPS